MGFAIDDGDEYTGLPKTAHPGQNLFGHALNDDADHQRMRSELTTKLRAKLARRILDLFPARDDTAVPSDEQLATDLADLWDRQVMPWGDFVKLVRLAAEDAGVFHRTASAGSASVAMALGVNPMSEAEAEQAAEVLGGPKYKAAVETDRLAGEIQDAMEQVRESAAAYREALSFLKELGRRRSVGAMLDDDFKRNVANLLNHLREAAIQHQNNRDFLPQPSCTGGATRTERQRNLR